MGGCVKTFREQRELGGASYESHLTRTSDLDNTTSNSYLQRVAKRAASRPANRDKLIPK